MLKDLGSVDRSRRDFLRTTLAAACVASIRGSAAAAFAGGQGEEKELK